MSFGCEWLDNVTLQSSGSFPCEYVKENWSEETLPTPYPCLAIENYVATQALAVTPAAATAASSWGTAVSAMQSNIAIADGKVTGTLKYLDEGQLVTDWGAGNFLVLKFSADDWDDYTSVKVGLTPSVSSGLVEVLNDPDKNGVFKITDKSTQKFTVVATDGENTKTSYYDLSGLTVETE